MNYQRIYDQIIQRGKYRQLNGYKEKHHILPRSMGGDDSPENLVELTAREHFLCHWLLIKIHPTGHLHYKAIHAFSMMMWCSSKNQERYRVTSRLYERLKSDYSRVIARSQSGEKNSQYGSMWITNGRKNQKIKQGDPIPEGWKAGRIINPMKTSLQKKIEKERKAAERRAKKKIEKERKAAERRAKKKIEKERKAAEHLKKRQAENAEFYQRHLNGESLRSIAKDAGCSNVALLYRFRRYYTINEE